MKPARLRYEDIEVGAVYEFERTIAEDDVRKFADLTGDHNPLHVDQEFGAQSQFGKNVVHGMLAGSFFSTLVGMYCPGKNALYVSQTLQFRKPLFYGEHMMIRGTVMDKHDALRMIVMRTEIMCEGEVVVDGEAKVRVTE